MAEQRALIICLAVTTAMLIQLAVAVDYTVGGPNGSWDTTTDLETWGSSQTFSVGDNLIFQYTANHDVVEVPKADYDSCQMSSVIQTYTGGNTIIPLNSPGTRYFICGTPGHCIQGMKLEIDTLATTSPPQASPVNPPISPPVPETSSPLPAQSPESVPAMSPVYPAESPMNGILDVPSGSPFPDVPSGSPFPDVPSGSPFPDVPAADSPGSSLPPGVSSSNPQSPDSSMATAGFETNLKVGFIIGMVMLLAL